MTSDAPLLVHGTAVALGPLAALIRGASGSGKSDLALRCLGLQASPLLDLNARLVADDQVIVTCDRNGLQLSAPPTISGKLEVRGLGIIAVGQVFPARLAVVVDLVAPDAIERMPGERTCKIAGLEVPLIALAPFEASAPLKLLLCLRRFSAPNP